MNHAILSSLEFPTANEAANIIDSLPREVTNSVTGDRMKVIHSVADGFDSVKIQFTLPPKATGAPLHYHLNFTETFEVTSGKLEMSIGDINSKRVVSPGELVTIETGIAHAFNNPNYEAVTFVSEAQPAAAFEKFIRAMYGLANDGKTNKDGMPTNLLHLALILDFADLNVPQVPRGLQTFLRKAIVGFARRIGAETGLKKYYDPNAS